jgi:hypothetical protein
MNNAIDDLGRVELDVRSGAFVNDTVPGADGSVLAVNTVPDSSVPTAGQTHAMATRLRERGVWAAAVGGGLLALGVAWMGVRLWPRRTHTVASYFMRKRPRRGLFSRR